MNEDTISDKKIFVPKFKKKLGFETTNARSNLMRKIRSKNNKVEKILRLSLWSKGVRYRKNFKRLPGSPDIVVTTKKLAIFIDGEFWHGFNWQQKRERIKINRDFWIPKIERNMQRDQENNKALAELGFKVIRFWENEIKKDFDKCLNIILTNLAA